jgi:ADP-heptose:LPS heptosyltransferase
MGQHSYRLLAINFGGIGDEILFLPTLQTIKQSYPNWHITLLLEPRSKAVAQVTDLVDAVVEFDIKKRPLLSRDLVELLGILRDGNYDCVLSSGSSPMVACLLFLSGIPERIGYDSGPLARLLLTRTAPLKREQYAADMYHDLVQGLGLKPERVLPVAVARKENIDRMEEFLKGRSKKQAQIRNQKRVIIHPGTSLLALQKGMVKTWPAESWVALLTRLAQHEDLQVILAGGPDDKETIEKIMTALIKTPEASKVVSAYGSTKSLADFAGLLKISDLLDCVDSAPMHLAVALGIPVVSMFGPTDPQKLLPEDERFKALRSQPSPDANGKFSLRQSTGRGVLLPPDIVYQTALDQLNRSKDQAHSLESLR